MTLRLSSGDEITIHGYPPSTRKEPTVTIMLSNASGGYRSVWTLEDAKTVTEAFQTAMKEAKHV